MWWTVTMSIYIGGAGSVIIGGLYWKKGTTAGAWAGFLVGFAGSMGGILAQEIYGKAFPLNGAQISFYTMLVSILVYIVVSLLTYAEDFDMDRMLHRGVYAPTSSIGVAEIKKVNRRGIAWGSLIGINEDFTPGDKWIAGGLFVWSMIFFGVSIGGALWYLARPWPVSVWSTFWHWVAVTIPIMMSVITGIWFTCGGVVDTIDLFRRLRLERVNTLDSGFVLGHQNMDESVLVKPVSSAPEQTYQPVETKV
jgi:SSS family solute:Na+ symporter